MTKTARHDALFLTLVVLLSVVPYVSQLGFYSDDWSVLSVLQNASDKSLTGLIKAQDEWGVIRGRPTQIIYQAALFKTFGLAPLGYHVVNAAVLVTIAVLLYAVCRQFGLHRTIGLAVTVVYILLPNYATDRFWFAAFTYGLSMALFLASTYAFLRAACSNPLGLWWAFAVITLSTAALGIELVVPLAVALPAAIALQWHNLGGLRQQLKTVRGFVLICSPLAVIAMVVVYKISTTQGIDIRDSYYLKQLIAGAATVNFGTYGIALIQTVAWSVRHLSLSHAVVAALLSTVVLLHLLRAEVPPASPLLWFKTVLVGCIVVALGAAIFLTTGRVSFWAAGIANRVWIAAALGVALVFIGGAGLVSSQLPNEWRRRAFSFLIAAFSLSSFLIDTALATYWSAAWPRQLRVLADIRRVVPELPSGATLILDGVCPYVGPAIVFEASWDLAGALRIAYRDPTLRADVATGQFSVNDDGFRTRIYQNTENYPYGPNLLLFDERRRTVVAMTDINTARAHLADRPACEEGRPGRGTLTLPLDGWYEYLISRDLLPF